MPLARLTALAMFSLLACTPPPAPAAAKAPEAASEKVARIDPDPCALPDNVAHPERAPIQAFPFRLADLPVLIRPSPDEPSLEPRDPRDVLGPLPAELSVLVVPQMLPRERSGRSLYVRLTPRYGFVSLPAPAVFACDEVGSPALFHFAFISPDRSLPRALRKPADYVEGDAWLDAVHCGLSLARIVRLKAMPIAAGALFGLREAPAVGERPDRLVLFMPRTAAVFFQGWSDDPTRESHGSLTRISVPLQRGGGGLFNATFLWRDLDKWLAGDQSGDADGETDHRTPQGERVTISVEITQTTADPEPLGLAYVEKSGTWQTIARTRLFDCPVDP